MEKIRRKLPSLLDIQELTILAGDVEAAARLVVTLSLHIDRRELLWLLDAPLHTLAHALLRGSLKAIFAKSRWGLEPLIYSSPCRGTCQLLRRRRVPGKEKLI